MENKTCFKCGQTKPEDEFYKHPMMADGRLGKCAECAKRDVRQNRLAKVDRYREWDRERARSPERKAAAIRYQRAGRKRNRLKYLARGRLAYALRT